MSYNGIDLVKYLRVYRQKDPLASSIKNQSFFNQPIDLEKTPKGKTRKWGDASDKERAQCIDLLIAECELSGLSDNATIYLVAMIYIESGFNPDAAATTTSACGLGQFINSTAKAYGLTKATRFDATENVRAICSLWGDLYGIAKKQTGIEQENDDLFVKIYKYYHDGFLRDYGGEGIAKDRIIPVYKRLLGAK